MKIIQDYIKKLTLAGSEMANRTAFENMLNDINNLLDVECTVTQVIEANHHDDKLYYNKESFFDNVPQSIFMMEENLNLKYVLYICKNFKMTIHI